MGGVGHICFSVCHPGEMNAGIRPFTDDIRIQCCSGDFGGNPGEFAEFMRNVLEEWYDGARVVTTNNCPPHLPDFYRGSAVRAEKQNTKPSNAGD